MKAFLVFSILQTILLLVYVTLYIRQTIRQLAGWLHKSSGTGQGFVRKGRQRR